MKHFTYGLSRYSPNSVFHNFFELSKGLLRTTGQYPKSIWYSLRYNAGEKFLLYTPSLYPYQYDSEIDVIQKREPARLSTQMITLARNLQMVEHENTNNKELTDSLESMDQSSVQQALKNYNESFVELYKSFEYNRENTNFDVPVVVPARTLYAATLYDKFNSVNKNSLTFNSIVINKDVLKFALQNFLKKLDYADADSISQVLHSLAHFDYFKTDVWNTLINELKRKHFEPEFTHVKPLFPKFYSYREVSQDYRSLNDLDNLGNELFVINQISAFEAYNAIKKASTSNTGINVDILTQLEERMPFLIKKEENTTTEKKE